MLVDRSSSGCDPSWPLFIRISIILALVNGLTVVVTRHGKSIPGILINGILTVFDGLAVVVTRQGAS